MHCKGPCDTCIGFGSLPQVRISSKGLGVYYTATPLLIIPTSILNTEFETDPKPCAFPLCKGFDHGKG